MKQAVTIFLVLMMVQVLCLASPVVTSHPSSQAVKVKKVSLVSSPEVKRRIFHALKKNLPKKYQGSASAITRTILNQAKLYRLDPYIITAVIAGESGYNPLARGSVGEIGLMQLRPETAEWVAKRMNLKWYGKKSLENPVVNIRYGSAYLAYLRDRLQSHGETMYLAAYNMGEGTVLKMIAQKIKPKIYYTHVMKRYLSLNSSTPETATQNL